MLPVIQQQMCVRSLVLHFLEPEQAESDRHSLVCPSARRFDDRTRIHGPNAAKQIHREAKKNALPPVSRRISDV
jgi:hypothetical protein